MIYSWLLPFFYINIYIFFFLPREFIVEKEKNIFMRVGVLKGLIIYRGNVLFRLLVIWSGRRGSVRTLWRGGKEKCGREVKCSGEM